MLEMNIKNQFLFIICSFFLLFYFFSCIKKPPLEDVYYVETYTSYSLRKLVSPEFYFQPLAFYRDDISRVDLYIKVGYNKLVFLKENDLRVARYNCKITIIDESKDSIVLINEFDKRIEEKEISDEKLQLFDYTLKSFKLIDGSYIISVKISDLNSNKFFSKIDRVVINSYKKSSYNVSDILLLNKVNSENDKIKITPIINKHIPYLYKDTVHTFFEIYVKEKQNIKIDLTLFKISYYWDKETDFITMYKNIDVYSQRLWETVNYQNISKVSIDTILNEKTNQFIFNLPLKSFSGNYFLTLKVKSEMTNDSIIKTMRFKILPEGFPKIINIDDKIAVSKLLRKVGERDFFPDNLTTEEKYERFERFWKGSNYWQRDDFFKRVELANERFTSFIEGWRTPMGKVFIICGEPDYIDNDRWIYQDQIVFDFAVIRDRGKYEVEEPIVVLRSYTENAYNFWYRCIDRCRTN